MMKEGSMQEADFIDEAKTMMYLSTTFLLTTVLLYSAGLDSCLHVRYRVTTNPGNLREFY